MLRTVQCTMSRQHTPPIFLKQNMITDLRKNTKNLEKLVQRLEEELLEHIYIYIYIYIY